MTTDLPSFLGLPFFPLSLLLDLLKISGLVDYEDRVLLLDLNLSTFQHGEQLRRGLSHPLHVVVQHKAFVARGSDCNTLSTASSSGI